MHGSPTGTGSRFGFWTFHCSLSALPGFILACRSGLGSDPVNILAMLLAIGTFILVYTGLSSFSPELSDPKRLAAATLRLICNYRSTLAVFSVPFALHNDLIMLLPDAWCGAIAIMFICIPGSPGGHAFMETYLQSIVVGAMLSGVIVAVYIPCLLARALFVSPASTQHP